jgi:hypothetical protein
MWPSILSKCSCQLLGVLLALAWVKNTLWARQCLSLTHFFCEVDNPHGHQVIVLFIVIIPIVILIVIVIPVSVIFIPIVIIIPIILLLLFFLLILGICCYCYCLLPLTLIPLALPLLGWTPLGLYHLRLDHPALRRTGIAPPEDTPPGNASHTYYQP